MSAPAAASAIVPGLPASVRPKSGLGAQQEPVPARILASRVPVLAEIARRYHDLVCPLNGPDRIRGDGESVPRMPPTYTATVREFERLMGVMRSQARQQAAHGEAVGTLRWHILAWYVDAEPVTRHRNVYVARHGKKPRLLLKANGKPLTRPETGFRRHPQARKEKADWGLEWMAERWGLGTEPMLPRELTSA